MMRALVDHHKKRMIGESAQQVGCTGHDPPGAVLYQPGHRDLEQDKPQNGKERILVFSNEFSHFRMLLQNLSRTESVGLLFFGINKISSL
jgi:hypothetical protein